MVIEQLDILKHLQVLFIVKLHRTAVKTSLRLTGDLQLVVRRLGKFKVDVGQRNRSQMVFDLVHKHLDRTTIRQVLCRFCILKTLGALNGREQSQGQSQIVAFVFSTSCVHKGPSSMCDQFKWSCLEKYYSQTSQDATIEVLATFFTGQ